MTGGRSEAAEAISLRSRLAGDPFARSLGIELLELGSGYARLGMTCREEMLNFFGMVHGGAIFALADVAHAAASNSHGVPATALGVNIQYVKPARAGQRLIAEAREEHLGRRTALYHIAVRDEATGDLIASAQGRVYRSE